MNFVTNKDTDNTITIDSPTDNKIIIITITEKGMDCNMCTFDYCIHCIFSVGHPKFKSKYSKIIKDESYMKKMFGEIPKD